MDPHKENISLKAKMNWREPVLEENFDKVIAPDPTKQAETMSKTWQVFDKLFNSDLLEFQGPIWFATEYVPVLSESW